MNGSTSSEIVLLDRLRHWYKTGQYDQELDDEISRIFQRLRNAIVRGSAAGGVLRGGLHLFSFLVRVVASRRKSRQSGSLALTEIAKDTACWMAFLGGLGGAYVAVDEGLAAVLGKQRTSGWRALIAGACAGPFILLTGSHTRHYSLATYVFVRSLTLLVRCGNKADAPALLHRLLAITRLEHGDTLLMCAAASQILYSYVCLPQTLPGSYVRFLTKQGGKELFVWNAIRETMARNLAGSPAAPLQSLQATAFAHHCSRIPCNVIHPGQSCPQHFGSFLLQEYPRALRVYFPVYLLPAILVHRRKLLLQPAHLGGKVVEGVARSSLFLTLYVGLAFAAACACHQITGTTTGALYASFLWIPGLATLVEKKSRRMELALYCVARAVESYGRCLLEWGVVKPKQVPVRLDVVLFSAAVGIIMHCYSDSHGKHRDVFRSKYLNILDAIFGNAGLNEGRIKHVPSNRDILQGVQHRAVRVIRKLGSTGSLQQLAGMAGPTAAPSTFATVARHRTHSSESLPEAGPWPRPHDAVPVSTGAAAGAAAAATTTGGGPEGTAAPPAAGSATPASTESATERTVDAAANDVPPSAAGSATPATTAGAAEGTATAAASGSVPPAAAGSTIPATTGAVAEGTAAAAAAGDATPVPGPAAAAGAAVVSQGLQPAPSGGSDLTSSKGEDYASAQDTLQTWSSGSLLDVAFASASSSSDVSGERSPGTPPTAGEGGGGEGPAREESAGQAADAGLSAVGALAMAVVEAAGEALQPAAVADVAIADAADARATAGESAADAAAGDVDMP